jgi:hypothetical protein
MIDTVKKIGAFMLGLAIFVAVCIVPFVFIKGAMWASENLLPPLVTIGWYAVALNLLLLLPLSLFRPLRGFTGSGMFSYRPSFLASSPGLPALCLRTCSWASGP